MSIPNSPGELVGRVHSIQTLGTLDGPGLRVVVFMQGCPLSCFYCHNKETWDFNLGTLMSVEELFQKILKYKSYFGNEGGVTVSGGEPTAQAEFVAGLFELLHAESIHTALDTAGPILNSAVRNLLAFTDLVILDIKSTDPVEFNKITGGQLPDTLAFLSECLSLGLDLWIRQVVIAGLNDDFEHMDSLASFLNEKASTSNTSTSELFRRIELLGSVPNLSELQTYLMSKIN